MLPLEQTGDIGLLILRLVVAIVFFYHALPKLKNTQGMAQMVGMPAPMVGMLGLIELLGALALALGVYAPIAALVLGLVMIGAIGLKVMKWHIGFAASDKTGWEFDLVLLAANLAILLTGGGAISLL